MSTQIKMIIPLLDPDITKDDISEEAGFVDGYLYDINRPSLTDNVFLMYKAYTHDIKAVRREEKFNDSPYIRSKRYIRVNGELYIVYTFVITEKDIRSLKKGLSLSTVNNTFRILSFWHGNDSTVNRAIVWPNESYTVQLEGVPEEDYIPNEIDDYELTHSV